MRRTLIVVGGWLNAGFILFHIFLGWQLHRLAVTPGLRGLLETFNLGGALMIAFFALVSVAFPDELLDTRVGRSALWLIVLVYATRALAEPLFMPRTRPVIVAVCLLVAAVYAVAGLLRDRPAAARAGVA